MTLESESNKPKRTGSLGLFFRKVYTLANLRLDHLCHGLNMYEDNFKRKIWTVFEEVLKEHTHLMKNRHLDQNLMCCVYIVFKVQGIKKDNKDEKIFNKIINQYKKQPQAEKHVYTRVFINGCTTTPKKAPVDLEEEPNDLIKYYNQVFAQEMMGFMKNFVAGSSAPPLSPLPKVKTHPPQSPIRKVSDHHSVFIRPLKNNPNDEVCYNTLSPHKPLCYSFSRSPAKVSNNRTA